MNPTLPRHHDARSISPSDRIAERALRDEIRAEVSRLLGERQLLSPGPEEEQRIRLLIAEHVATFQRRAATTNGTLLHDVEGIERRIFDSLFRLGILQPLIDDPKTEEIIVNGCSRVYAIQDGEKRLVSDLIF